MTRIPNRALLLPLLALGILLLASCIEIQVDGDSFGNGEDGSGVLVTETRSVADFNAVEVSGALRVDLDRGPFRVEVEFDDNLLEKLETSVRGGAIHIRCRDCDPSSGAVVRLSAPEIDAIEVSGASRVVAEDIRTEALHLSISGASTIEIDGDVTSLEIDGSGASTVDGPELITNQLDVDLSGASRAELTVIDRVSGDLSGASQLRLRGDEDPSVDAHVSGGSSINR